MIRTCLSLSAAAGLWLGGLALPSTSHAQSAPTLVKDFYLGRYSHKYGTSPNSGSPRLFTRVQNRLVFIARSEAGFGLWRTNGAAEGTQLLKLAFNPSRYCCQPLPGYPTDYREVAGQQLMAVGDVAVLPFGEDPEHGLELWKTDGTAEGTVLLKDIAPGPAHSFPVLLAQQCDTVFFSVHVGEAWELWKTDGTEAGTVRVRALSGQPSSLVTGAGATLYFTVAGTELWKTDGTEAGTMRVRAFTAVGMPRAGRSRVFFAAQAEGDSAELWTSDGTEAGTSRVKDINTDNSASSVPEVLHVEGDRAYFRVWRPETGNEPWVTDGTEAGTRLLKDLFPGPSNSSPRYAHTLPDGRVLLWADSPSGFEQKTLWVTDGSEAGTQALRVLVPPDTAQMVQAGDLTLFLARDPSEQNAPARLWRTQGTEAGTWAVRNFNVPRTLRAVDGRILFFADGSLWTTGGLPESTRPVTLPSNADDSPPGSGASFLFLDETRGTLLFTGGTPETGSELFAVNLEPLPALAPRPPAACTAPGEEQPEPPPEKKGGCAAAAGTGAVLPGVLVLLLALRHRRREAGTGGPGLR